MEEDYFSCVWDGGLGKRVLQQDRNLGKRICFKHGLGMEREYFSKVGLYFDEIFPNIILPLSGEMTLVFSNLCDN